MHLHAVRRKGGGAGRAAERTPPRFRREPSAVLRVEAGRPVLEGAEAWLEARDAHARRVGWSGASGRRELRRLNEAVFTLAAVGWLELAGGERCRLLRVEGYGPGHDAASSRAHDEGTAEFWMTRVGGLYFQRYAGGHGWGLSIRMPRGGQVLVRAAEDEESGEELGMTEVARKAAAVLGIRLDARESRYHVPTDVGDLASDGRVRIVLCGYVNAGE